MNADRVQFALARVADPVIRSAARTVAESGITLYATPLTIRAGAHLLIVISSFNAKSPDPASPAVVTLCRGPSDPAESTIGRRRSGMHNHALGRLELEIRSDGRLAACMLLPDGSQVESVSVRTTLAKEVSTTADWESPAAFSHQTHPRTSPTFYDRADARHWGTCHIGIIGTGRTGSIVADLLASQGVRQLTLVDDDFLAASNLDGTALFRDRDVGELKVNALGRALCDRFGDLSVRIVAERFPSVGGIESLSLCDAVVTAVDRAAPRLWASRMTRTLLQAHLDIGTGPDQRSGFGADVRWFPAPTQPGCLLCIGGVRSDDADRPGTVPRAINGEAAHVACDLLLRAFAGSVAGPHWLRLRHTTFPVRVESQENSTRPRPDCPWCGQGAETRSFR